MAKRKTRKQKENLQLRKEVEALKAELKAYKVNEQPAKKSTYVKEIPVTSTTNTLLGYNPKLVKKDIKTTLIAFVICLLVLISLYFLLPYQERIIGFFRYGDFSEFSNWRFWK